MKTSEFIKKIENSGLYTRINGDTIVIYNPSDNSVCATVNKDVMFVCHIKYAKNRKATLERLYYCINEYTKTPLDDRKDERKWVIPWGVDADGNTQNAWQSGGTFIVDYAYQSDWRKHDEYQFTDSELEQLKSTQSPAIAKAIDIAKELVSDD